MPRGGKGAPCGGGMCKDGRAATRRRPLGCLCGSYCGPGAPACQRFRCGAYDGLAPPRDHRTGRPARRGGEEEGRCKRGLRLQGVARVGHCVGARQWRGRSGASRPWQLGALRCWRTRLPERRSRREPLFLRVRSYGAAAACDAFGPDLACCPRRRSASRQRRMGAPVHENCSNPRVPAVRTQRRVNLASRRRPSSARSRPHGRHASIVLLL